MGTMRIRDRSELAAAVPHLLGFHPTDSVVCLPAGGTGPTARVDLQPDDEGVVEVAEALAAAYLRHEVPSVAYVSFTEDRGAALKHLLALTIALQGKVEISTALWVDHSAWTDLATGESGQVDPTAATRIAAEAVALGRRMPVSSRADLATNLHGDPAALARVAALLPAATTHVSSLTTVQDRADEHSWVTDVVSGFARHQRPLSDEAAARLLIAVQTIELRDAAWSLMSQHDAPVHAALWHDLTRRAPQEVRTPPAALLAFSSWLAGDGAQAWVALDLIPSHHDYPLARLVTRTLEEAVPPSMWNDITKEHNHRLRGSAQAARSTFIPPTRDEDHTLKRRPTPGTFGPRPAPPTP